MKAMLFAAGLGTRLKPLTDTTPKCLVQAGGKTLLEHSLDALIRAGVDEVVINVHHLREQVIEAVGSFDLPLKLHVSIEQDLLETGGGLLFAADHFRDEDAFLVCNSDIYSELDLGKLVSTHRERGSLATLAVANRETSRYLRFDEQGHLCGWENRRSGEEISWNDASYETWAFNGIQVMSGDIFSYMAGRGKKFSTIPVYLDAARAGEAIGHHPMDGIYWMDVGTIEKLESLRGYLG